MFTMSWPGWRLGPNSFPAQLFSSDFDGEDRGQRFSLGVAMAFEFLEPVSQEVHLYTAS